LADVATKLPQMTRGLFTLAYPVLSAADRAMIRAFRVEYDRSKVHRVEPHFTIGFGISGVDGGDYLEHGHGNVAGWPRSALRI